MKAWQAAIVGWACMAAAGCRTDPAVTALERENRYLEDALYEVQDTLDKTQDALDACRRDNEGPRKGDRAAPHAAPERPAARGAPASEAPREPAMRGPELSPLPRSSRTPGGVEPPALPKIELPPKALPPGEIPETFRTPEESGSRKRPALPERFEADEGPGRNASPAPRSAPGLDPVAPHEPRKLDAPPGMLKGTTAIDDPSQNLPAAYREQLSAAVPVEARADSASVRQITLHPALTGGFDAEPQPGDEGILVLIEPRNAQGKPAAAAAPISVVLLDAALPGEAARVARWDLTAEDLAASYCRMPQAEGFCLGLPWSATPPVHGHLHLFVRYTTRDGRNLEARREIDVALPGRPAEHWAAAPAGKDAPSPSDSSWRERPPRAEPSGPRLQEPTRLAEDGQRAGSSAAAEAPTTAGRRTPATSDAASPPARESKTRTARPVWSPYRR